MRLTFLALLSLLIVSMVGAMGFTGVNRLGESLNVINSRMLAANALLGLRAGQLTALGEVRNALTWDLATYDALANKTDAVGEANDFFSFALKSKRDADALTKRYWEVYAAAPKVTDEAKLWDSLQEDWKVYSEGSHFADGILEDLAKAKEWTVVLNRLSALRSHENSLLAAVKKSGEALDKILDANNRTSEETRINGQILRTTITVAMSAFFAAGVVALAVAGFVLIRNVIRSFEAVRSAIVQVARSGDFRTRAQLTGSDEPAQIALAFNGLLEGMQSALSTVIATSARLSEMALSVAEAAGHVSRSSTAQNEAAEGMAAAVQQTTESASHIAAGAREALDQARAAGSVATEGAIVIAQAEEEMSRIVVVAQAAGETMASVGHQSDRISSITEVIREVTDQTNLLALNAAIEAARAGEQGQGFAVVADEVRKLAERTSQAAAEIAEMIHGMQGAAAAAIEQVNLVQEKVVHGKSLSGQAAQSMNLIHVKTNQVAQAINGISAAMAEHSSTTQHIARQVETVTSMSDRNCRAAAETARMAEEWETLAGDLRLAAGRFSI